MPHNPELSVAVLEFPLVAATSLPGAHLILGLYRFYLRRDLFPFLIACLIAGFGACGWGGWGRRCSRFALFAFVHICVGLLSDSRPAQCPCCPWTGLAFEPAWCPLASSEATLSQRPRPARLTLGALSARGSRAPSHRAGLAHRASRPDVGPPPTQEPPPHLWAHPRGPTSARSSPHGPA